MPRLLRPERDGQGRALGAGAGCSCERSGCGLGTGAALVVGPICSLPSNCWDLRRSLLFGFVRRRPCHARPCWAPRVFGRASSCGNPRLARTTDTSPRFSRCEPSVLVWRAHVVQNTGLARNACLSASYVCIPMFMVLQICPPFQVERVGILCAPDTRHRRGTR